MTKIKILCLTVILLLVVECHLRQTQLSSVFPTDGEKDDAYDILDANLDKLIKIMTLSKGNTVNVTSMIVSIVDLALGTSASLLPNTPPAASIQKLFELDGRIRQLESEVLRLQFLTKAFQNDLRLKVKVPLGTLVSRINRYKGGAEGLPALNASCQEYDTDKLFITYIGDLPDLLAWQMKEANYAKNVWDASVKTIEGISKQLAYVFGLCQVVVLGIPDAWLNKALHDRAFNWGSQIDNIIKHRFEKMKAEYWKNDVITKIMDNIFHDNRLNTDEKLTKADSFFQLNWRQFGYSFYRYAVEAPMKDPGAAASFGLNYWEKWYPDYNLMVGMYRNKNGVSPNHTCTFDDIFGGDICTYINMATYTRVRWEISERMKSKCKSTNKKIMFADSSEKWRSWSAYDTVKCFDIYKNCFFYQPKIFVCVM